jgi:hypothetical protein
MSLEREEISQKFQRIWIQHAKSILAEYKNRSKIMMHCYKISKTFTVTISGQGQNLGKRKKCNSKITKWDLC